VGTARVGWPHLVLGVAMIALGVVLGKRSLTTPAR
jgi:hypothetical protein